MEVILTAFGSAIVGSFLGPIVQRVLATKLSAASRREAERDEMCARIASDIDALLADCEEFWSQDASVLGEQRNGTLKARIGARAHNLNHLIYRLFNGTIYLAACRSEHSKLRQACMMGDFDENDRKSDYLRLGDSLEKGWEMQFSAKGWRSEQRRGWLSG